MLSRRQWLAEAGVLALASGTRTWAASKRVPGSVILPLPGGPGERPITTSFPQKGAMILQHTRQPLLETPFEVFDKGVLTPVDRFYVRWHLPNIPQAIDADKFRLTVHGQVDRELSLSLKDILSLPEFEIVAANQCSGNSRGFFQPRVAGGEWANGAMGNARWTGVKLKDVLDRAGVKSDAIQVRFNGMDSPSVPDAPDFMKSLAIDHARDGEVMIAYAMNGKPLPLLNGFPVRLVVPGWFATYWIKMLNDIEVLNQPDTNFWMKTAYTIPDLPRADMQPGQAGVKMVPITKIIPRTFITNLARGATIPRGKQTPVRGIAFGGDTGVSKVEFSGDDGKSWQAATLGKDEGKYSFRFWKTVFTAPVKGEYALMVRCTNNDGAVQPDKPNWNPAGYMRNVVESLTVAAV
jgi:DMSO/TMAO reductase YedYZ molybdopterin-dependent catalytic subunit